MEDRNEIVLEKLEQENERMKQALKDITAYQAEIQNVLDEVQDLLYEEEHTENAPVTEDDVISLLKKYSRLK